MYLDFLKGLFKKTLLFSPKRARAKSPFRCNYYIGMSDSALIFCLGADIKIRAYRCLSSRPLSVTLLLDQTDGMYINVYDHEVTLSLSLWDAKRMQSFIEQWKNTDLTSAYEQVFTQVSAGSNTTCRLYGVELSATLDESRYVPTLDDCTFYFLMTNPSTNFRAAVEVNYSITNQRLTAMNWQYE